MGILFPTSIDLFYDKVDFSDEYQASHVNACQDAVVLIETKVGVNSSGDTNSLDYKINNFFTSGRKVWIYENTAPIGWTLESLTDRVIGVKGGSQAYNISGGNTAGTWTASGLTMVHTHPGTNHKHQWYYYYNGAYHDRSYDSGGVFVYFSSDISKGYNAMITLDTYGTSPSVSYYTSNSGTANTGAASTSSVSSNAVWRPYACVGIIISKD